MQITKPYTHVAGTNAEAAKVNANDDTMYNDHNGNITDFNISVLANINQSKILNLIPDLNTIRGQKVQEVNVVMMTASGIYTKPGDLLFARILCIGAGGGGAAARSDQIANVSSGGGGGAGAYGESWLSTAFLAATEIVTIGAGGAGGVAGGPTDGFQGGQTIFGAGSLVWVNGGNGGKAALNSINTGGTGGDFGGGAQINIGGEWGHCGFITTAPFGVAAGGRGGTPGVYGFPGPGTPTGNVTAGSSGGNGGGGSGAATVGINEANGGVGGNGLVIVFEFKA